MPLDHQLHQRRYGAAFRSGRVLAASGGELVTVQALARAPEFLTCVEELAMFGQLSQIAVYAAKGLNRRQVPNLWLRHLTLERSPRRPDKMIRTTTSITRDRVLNVGGAGLSDVRLTSRTGYGARAEAAFAYRVPF